MEIFEFIGRHKNKALNIVIIIIALNVAGNIYKKQALRVGVLEAQKESEIKKNTALEEISGLEKKINSYKQLFKEKESDLIFGDINNIANACSVKIVSIKPGQEQKFTDYLKVYFDLVINATNYHSLAKFINILENSPDIYIVDSLDTRVISGKKEQGNNQGGLSVGLKISAISYL
jgi:Tfp pilus assembly protein PilO